MKKIIYIVLLLAMTPVLKAQFAAVLTNEGFTRLENDSAVLTPADNLRGTFQWQKSTDSLSWTEVEANLTGDTLAFVPEITEAYRLQITEGTCLPIYGDTVKVFNKNTTVSEYLLDGISIPDLLTAGASVADLLTAGVTINGLSGTNTDQDENHFEWIGIGDQLWMAENLKTTHYANGAAIPLVEGTADWSNLVYTDSAYCYYDNSSGNGNTYGALYTWSASLNVCPSGWHLPSDAEWKQLEMYLGMSQDEADGIGYPDGIGYRGTNEGSKLAGNASLWNSGNLENNAAFGSSGFTALPGGDRTNHGTFSSLGNYASFWSATENSSPYAWFRTLYYNFSDVYRGGNSYYYKNYGYSVRCTKD